MTDSGAYVGVPPPPRPRWGVGKILGIGCLGLIAMGAGIFFLVMRLTQPVVDVADAFMGALRDGDNNRAFQIAAPPLQRELGSAEQLGASIGAYRPQDWSWSSRSIRNDRGNVSGSVTYQGGRTGTAQIRMSQVDGEWRVTAYRLN
jgi:hypothetical protein